MVIVHMDGRMAVELNDFENKIFMMNPERTAAENRVREAKAKIRSIQTECTSAEVILKLMPPAVAELGKAYELLLATEARIKYEILEKRKKSDTPTDQS